MWSTENRGFLQWCKLLLVILNVKHIVMQGFLLWECVWGRNSIVCVIENLELDVPVFHFFWNQRYIKRWDARLNTASCFRRNVSWLWNVMNLPLNLEDGVSKSSALAATRLLWNHTNLQMCRTYKKRSMLRQ